MFILQDFFCLYFEVLLVFILQPPLASLIFDSPIWRLQEL